MALAILDGNQSATTLSSILTSGEHIPAHTVVSLGTQAITDMRGAVSGSVVSISNFPATQPVSIASVTVGNTVTIAGTVTANPTGTQTIAGTVTVNSSANFDVRVTQGGDPVDSDNAFPVYGTVTANVFGKDANSSATPQIPVIAYDEGIAAASFGYVVPVQVTNVGGQISEANPLPISGTVTVGNSVTIASLPAVTVGELPFWSTYDSGNDSLKVSINDVGGSIIDGSSVPISGTVTVGAVSTTVTIANHQGTSVTTSNFTSTTASTTLASANASREVLTIFNEGAGNLHICAGATCTTIAYQVRLSAGDYYEVPLNQTSLTHSAVFATAGTARVTQIS